MDRFIEIKNLVKLYYGHGLLHRGTYTVRAVDRVSFAIDRNQIFGLVGESGCGKTSLVRSVLYLDPPTSGEIWMDGVLLGKLTSSELRSFRKRMQIVFQDPNSALNPKMRIQDSLAEGLINRKIPSMERSKRINEILNLVGIPPTHSSRFPHEFSGGQKQRIVIARALVMEPDFLVLDEPVSNLDVSIQAQIINLLLDLKKELSLTYLFISHDLNLVAYLSDQIGVMYRGRIVEQAETDEIMNHPNHPYTLKLFSSVPGQSNAEAALENSAQATRAEIIPALASYCQYIDQCPLGDQACREAEPELREIRPGHQVACFKAAV